MTPLEVQFTPYGVSHVGALVVLVLGLVALVVAGRRRRDRDPGDRLGKVFAALLLLAVLPLQVLYFTPGYWDLDKTLPIQLCDLASLVAAYALWTHRRWATALTYYWGLFLTTQAIVTPDLDTAFPGLIFWLYWAMHIGTVWAAVYLTWGRGEQPDWHSYRIAVVATAIWAAALFCFNVVADTNYGFLNHKPSSTSILDVLGPWPWYVAAEIAIVVTVWALATWPWAFSPTRPPAGRWAVRPTRGDRSRT